MVLTATVGIEIFKPRALLAQSSFLMMLATHLKSLPVSVVNKDELLPELENLLILDSSLQLYIKGKPIFDPELFFVSYNDKTRILVLGASLLGATDLSYYDIFDLTAKEIQWLGDTAKSFIVFRLGPQRTTAKAFLPMGNAVFREDAYRAPKKLLSAMVSQFR